MSSDICIIALMAHCFNDLFSLLGAKFFQLQLGGICSVYSVSNSLSHTQQILVEQIKGVIENCFDQLPRLQQPQLILSSCI